MIFLPFFGALMMATTSYLQFDAKWWKGLIAAATLFLIGLISIFFLENVRSPAFGVASAFLFGSILVGASSIVTLILRMHFAASKAIFLVFVFGWLLIAVVPFVIW
jgi:phosphatidylserine synthase